MLTSRFGFGYGLGYSACKEASALVTLGHTVTVVHCYSSPEIAHFFDPQITRVYLPMKRIPLVGFLLYFFTLKKFFRKKLDLRTFEIIYIQSLEFGLLDLSRVETPVFYYARSTMRGLQHALHNEGEKKSSLANIIQVILVALERRCMRYSKIIFVKSSQMAHEVSNFYGIPTNKIAVITGGVDEKDFQRQSYASCTEFKRKFKIPLNVPLVLYAGRIVPQKGLSYLIEASLELFPEKQFVVAIAGAEVDVSYSAKVKRRVKKSDYPTRFYFLGHVDQREMSFVFNAADCLVTPSVYEPFGMVNLQAAFLNKYIITTDVTGSVELLANYKRIRIVHARSSSAIKLALRQVLSETNNIGQEVFDFQGFSWLDAAKKLTQFFGGEFEGTRKKGS